MYEISGSLSVYALAIEWVPIKNMDVLVVGKVYRWWCCCWCGDGGGFGGGCGGGRGGCCCSCCFDCGNCGDCCVCSGGIYGFSCGVGGSKCKSSYSSRICLRVY